jgi:hypothetical protein
MPAGIVQSASGANNAPASATQTATLGGAATAGNQILLVVGGDDYAATPPTGFTEHTGAKQETFLGHYLWRKTAAGGETSISYTLGSAAPSCWAIAEISGIDSTTPYDISTGTFDQSSGTTYTTPTLTPTSGDRLLVATIGGALNSAFSGLSGWTNSFTELQDVWTTLASGTRDSIGLATLAVTANGATAYSTGITWDGAVTPQARTAIIISLKVAGGAPAAASSPPRPMNRFRRHLLVR